MNIVLKHFNELSADELYNILRLRCEIFIVEQDCPYQDCDLKDKDAYHLYFEEDGEIITYVRILKRGVSYKEASIGRVVCNEKHRGTGIAKKCMKKAIDFIKNDLNENKIRISAQEYAKEFYEKVGFKKVSIPYLEDGIPHIEMLYCNK